MREEASAVRFTAGPLSPAADPTFRDIPPGGAGGSEALSGIVHYTGYIQVAQLVSGIPNSPNLRATNLKSQVSKIVRQSLCSNDGTFHLKNKGITLIASVVEPTGRPGEFLVEFTKNGLTGIVDGGHTYSLIREALDAGLDLSCQHVLVRIMTGVPRHLVPVVAEGLNASTAVSQGSLVASRGGFDWLIASIPDEKDFVAWRQNDRGVKVETLLPLIHALYSAPKGEAAQARSAAYSSRSRSLRMSSDPGTRFTDYAPLVRDAFFLYERIERRFSSWSKYRLGVPPGGKKASLFGSTPKDTYRPAPKGLALPILGAFRPLVLEQQGKFRFDRDLEDLLALFCDIEVALKDEALRLWKDSEVQGNINAFGKSEKVWNALEKVVSDHLASPAPTPGAARPAPVPAGWPDVDRGELIALWEEELADLKANEEAAIEGLAAARSDGARREGRAAIEELSRTAHHRSKLVRQQEEAIRRARAGLVGVCCGCEGKVEEARVLDARLSLYCVTCARSS